MQTYTFMFTCDLKVYISNLENQTFIFSLV